jgi:EpsI family protein
MYVSMADGSKAVFLSIVLTGRDRTSIHRPELCLVGQGWTIRGTARHVFRVPAAGREIPATLLRTERVDRAGKFPALVAYWFVSSDAIVGSHVDRFLHDAWNRLRYGRADRWAYVLMQTDARDGEAAALARLQAVLSQAAPAFLAIER